MNASQRILVSYFFWFATLSILFTSCQTSTSQEDQREDHFVPQIARDIEDIRRSGKLVALIDNSSTGYFVYKGRTMGFEYELLTRLAKYLGVELELVISTDIQKSIESLNNGEVDIIAQKLTITRARKEVVDFTKPLYLVRQVLVQRKPGNWRNMKLHEIERQLLRNPIELIGKEIYVRKNSSFSERLKNLSEEIGGDIYIQEDSGQADTETFIHQVVNNEIDYTVADEDIASVNAAYYPVLDVKTPISLAQQVGWAVRKNAPNLLREIDTWLTLLKHMPDYNVIYNRYFKSPRASILRAKSDYSSISGNKISPYDNLIHEAADSLDWDWRLLAAMVYQESRFDPQAESWAGAQGLMQLVPETGKMFGASNLFAPLQNVKAGTQYLRWLEKLWDKRIPDPNERTKFVLASYNVGQGHVLDAVRLAKKYKVDTAIWEGHVEQFLLKKSQPQFYKDEVVKNGYCRGEEPVNYVKDILDRYQDYVTLLNKPVAAS